MNPRESVVDCVHIPFPTKISYSLLKALATTQLSCFDQAVCLSHSHLEPLNGEVGQVSAPQAGLTKGK